MREHSASEYNGLQLSLICEVAVKSAISAWHAAPDSGSCTWHARWQLNDPEPREIEGWVSTRYVCRADGKSGSERIWGEELQNCANRAPKDAVPLPASIGSQGNGLGKTVPTSIAALLAAFGQLLDRQLLCTQDNQNRATHAVDPAPALGACQADSRSHSITSTLP
jgi:hypothetical protein